MGTVSCRSCNGAGRKWVDFRKGGGKFFDCKACNGSGINYKLWSTRCQRCRTEIIYKAYTEEPRFCRMCKNIELEKVCSQFGCTNRIKYKVGWTNVSDYCGPCRKKREQGWSASTCPGTGLMGCGKLIWSPPGKRFTLCRDCNQRKRAEEEAKWKEKACPGTQGKSCGKKIRYNTDWNRIPDICPDCIKQAKQAKADREASKRTKPCKRCGSSITYFEGGREYDYCKNCNDLRVRVTKQGDNFQAVDKGQVLFTFGRCRSPRRYSSGQQLSEKARLQAEWHNRGYWFLSLPGKMHETYIITKRPVEQGFVEASWDDVVAMKTNPGSLIRGFSAITHALINWDEYDL